MELGKTPSGNERRRLVEKDALGPWGKKKVADLTRRDAVILLDKVRQRAPVVANRLQGVLVRMFNFAAERGIIEHSPLTGMRKTREAARKRVLADEEIKALWASLDLENEKIDIYRVTKLAIKLILLTGQRPGEVAGMEFRELDPRCHVVAYSGWTDERCRSSNGPDLPYGLGRDRGSQGL